MELTAEQRRQKFLLELKDLLTGAAFPLMLQIIFSASVILFAGYTAEPALQVVALVFGELLLAGAYVIFGRQNGISAYRRFVQTNVKREAETADIKAYYKTGEYAIYKGFVIGLLSVVPFMVFQFIECLAPNSFCGFLLKYAFGWAAFPFELISELPSVEALSEWLNFIWIAVPVCIHALAYVLGAKGEKKRQQKMAEARQIKEKKRR